MISTLEAYAIRLRTEHIKSGDMAPLLLLATLMRMARAALDLKQTDVGAAISMTTETISAIENASKVAHNSSVRVLAGFYEDRGVRFFGDEVAVAPPRGDAP